MKTKRILVQSAAGSYAVVCGAGALRHAASEVAKLGKFSSVQIVSSKTVWRAIGKNVQRGLRVKNSHHLHFMDDGESAKSLRTVELLARDLVKSGADRGAVLIAV